MKHSVVIGGAGFVGSWVVEELLKEEGRSITVVDNLLSSERWNLSTNPRVSFVEGSAAEMETLEKIVLPVDEVYQLACFHGNQSSIARPFEDLENGLKTTLTTLEWVKQNHPKARVVYSGAGCAVAEKTWEEPTAVEEVDQTSLLHDSPYSISKITGEMYCLYYARQYEMDIVRVRFQNVYGPREILGAGQWRGTENTIWRNVIPTFVWKAIHNEPVQIYGDGTASRDFIYVGDVADGVIKANKFGVSGQVYNISSGIETNLLKLISSIELLTHKTMEVNFYKKRNWDHSGRRFGSPVKSMQSLGFESQTSLTTGLARTIDWTIENVVMIESAMEKHENKI
jgi:nucleoside-diphosphate-sugar epimerase